MKRMRVTAAAAVIVSAATLAYALWNADLAALWQSLRGMRGWATVPFLAILFVFFLTNARRWALMLRPFCRYRTAQVAPAMMIGLAGNNVLPLRLGELVRTVVFASSAGQPRSGVLSTLVAERLLDLIAILTVFIVGLLLLDDPPTALRVSAWTAGVALAVLSTAMIPLVAWPAWADRAYAGISRRLPESVAARGAVYLAQFRRGFAFLSQPKLAGEVAVLSLVRWLLAVALVWLSVAAYGEEISVPVAMATLGVTAFAVSLPSAPGFVGPIQAAFVITLTPFGLTHETALAASIFFLVGHWLPVTAVGAMYFVGHDWSFGRIRSEAQAIAEA
ncbi:MAG: flippase-like protein [Deltaproteobacteria bacterium]|nr:flippase-like protein [Deltaproteobacteria bacterium]